MSKTMYEIEGYLFEVIGWGRYNGKPIPIIDNCSIGKIKELPEAASAAAAATAGKKMMMITGKSSSRNMSMKMWSGSFEHLREVNRSTKRA